MKKAISVIIILLIGILSVSSISYAATLQATLDITVDKQEVDAGGEYVTFDLKIKDIANAADGSVTAAEGVITYNTDFFETINPDDCTGIVVNQTNGMFSVAFSATSAKELGSIKLKVKSSPTGAGTVKFTGLNASDGEAIATTADKEFTIKIKSSEPGEQKTLSGIKVTKEPNKVSYTEGESFNKSGMVITASYSDGTSKEVTNYSYEPKGALSKSTTKIIISYTESGVTKTTEQKITVNAKATSNTDKDDDKNNNNNNNNNNNSNTNQTAKEDPTTANKVLAKTGMKDYIVIIIATALTIVIGIVAYIKYNKYKGI